MSAEVLREAAALMRERAESATPGPWVCYGDHLVWPGDNGPSANDPILAMGDAHEDSKAHIASWHPTVALAVADWLDNVAKTWWAGKHVEEIDALAVATAYLGEAS